MYKLVSKFKFTIDDEQYANSNAKIKAVIIQHSSRSCQHKKRDCIATN